MPMTQAPTALPPSTSDYVRFHALHRPDAIALVNKGRSIDYATFDGDLGRFTRALHGFGLPRRSTVAVACEDLYVHWLLLLACEDVGVATISFLNEERDLPLLLAHVGLVLSSHELAAEDGPKLHRLTKEWLADVFASPAIEAGDAPPTPAELDDPQRMRRSSGTTGGPKLMVAKRKVEEHRVSNHSAALGFTSRSRLLISTPFAVGSIYAYATACLRVGGTGITSGKDLAREIVQHRPTHVRLYPFQVKELLDQLPGDFRKPAEFTVILGAAPLSEALQREILARLATRLDYLYSINEVGTIAAIGADGLGTLRPGVRAKIVDAGGAPVPAGKPGRLRVKTMTMVDGYLGNPQLTARAFRDGWFDTSDDATLLPSGHLKLAGRSDDVLNIGGVKFAPQAIEDLLTGRLPDEELAVTSLPDAEGIEELVVAVVFKDRAKAGEDATRIGKCLPKSLGRIRVIGVTRIPRTAETGKVQRARLKAMVAGK
jgi:acyl-coenzyme A synthetase/AMP-(fatty) acid ligase